ncbi:MAG: hypothetical protein NC341_06485 [Blautia sp.]|nr:hypothetical protein [Blautia sp.]MCM1200987.1 hypothetical protein [Bacteroides fragilis]
MGEDIQKKEVEELLKYEIEDGLFQEALQYARKMQNYVYQCEKRLVVLQHWYLVKLTEEYVRMLAFSQFTTDICSGLTKEGDGKTC